MLAEFSQFGTNVIGITAGRQGTAAVRRGAEHQPDSPRGRRLAVPLAGVTAVTPVVWGNPKRKPWAACVAPPFTGVGSAMQKVFAMRVRSGRFLPPDDPPARAFAVLGAKPRTSSWHRQPVGQRIRIGGERYRVIGVMEEKGQFLGTDLDDTAYIPTGRAMALYNRSGLLEIDVSYREGIAAGEVASAIRSRLSARHGREDFTHHPGGHAAHPVEDPRYPHRGGRCAGRHFLARRRRRNRHHHDHRGLRAHRGNRLAGCLGARRSNILLLFLGEAIALAAAGGVFGLLLGARSGCGN